MGDWMPRADDAGVDRLLFRFGLPLLILTAVVGTARAQPAPAVGYGPEALPAVHTVGVLIDQPPGFAATAGLGYAHTEDVLDAGDSHQRISLRAAGGYRALSWLGLSARLLGRLDRHSGGPDDGTDGVITEAALHARAQHGLSPQLRMGGQLALRFPASDGIGNGLSAISTDLQGLLTLAPPSMPLHAAALLGFRLDRAREGIDDTALLSPSDRVALGASAANAVLLGLGVSYRIDRLDLLGEWSWDPGVGSGAPKPLESPMRISAGARYFPTDSLQVELLAAISPSARPDLSSA
ncbi:MAG: hypothetical protein OXT09_11065, partial [Myxococcales bacterium]|nr:hypothetical protein [Myxococcales bacterium]